MRGADVGWCNKVVVEAPTRLAYECQHAPYSSKRFKLICHESQGFAVSVSATPCQADTNVAVMSSYIVHSAGGYINLNMLMARRIEHDEVDYPFESRIHRERSGSSILV